MEFGDFGLRDAIVVASVLAGIYVVVMALRLMQLRKARPAPAVDLVPPKVPEAPAGEDEDDDVPVMFFDVPRTPFVPPPAPAYDEPEPESEPVSDFGAHLQRTRHDNEVRLLRDEVMVLRAEVAELKAARRVSPQYADAMALAQRGLTAQDLADRCGISLGEAELVSALAREAVNFDDEDDHGGKDRRIQSAA